MEKQIEEELRAIDGKIDQLGRYEVGGRRVLLGVCIAEEKPNHPEQVPADFERGVDAGLDPVRLCPQRSIDECERRRRKLPVHSGSGDVVCEGRLSRIQLSRRRPIA